MSSLMPNGRSVWRTTHWAPLASGPKIRTVHSVGIDSTRATSSARAMARVLGRISAKITTRTVMMAVAISAPSGPGKAALSTLVVRAEAPMLMTLLPSRMAPIIVSWLEISRLTRRAARSPSRSSWCIRPRLAAVIEVSADAEFVVRVMVPVAVDPSGIGGEQ